MNIEEVGQYWNNNANAWTELAQAGYDIYRNHLNTPAFFKMLPHIKNLKGLDIGCGEGYNTRLLAEQGAIMEAIDISEIFIERARNTEVQSSLAIHYQVASATKLPFENNSFDFTTSFMCMMDIPNPEMAIKEACRVLKPGGFFQFSITHPCFATPHRKNLRTLSGKTYAIEVGDYFKNKNGEIEDWIFSASPQSLKKKYPKFKIPVFNYTLSFWINTLISNGFTIQQINEPYPDDETVKKYPGLQDAQTVAYFLHILCKKTIENNQKNI
jgi:ubiquinone/menaquinone biosynthesis C-methylase UbiE